MPPVNDALRLEPGRTYRIHSRGHVAVVEGVCTYRAPDRVVLTNQAGSFTFWTGRIGRIDNLGGQP